MHHRLHDRGSLSGEISVLGVSVQRKGLCPGGSLSGGLCPGKVVSVQVQGGLCPGKGVSVQEGVSFQGASVWGSLSRGLCPGRSLSRERSLSRRSLSRERSLSMRSLSRGVSVQEGVPVRGVSVRESSHMVTSGWYASYWNAFLFLYSDFLAFMFVMSLRVHEQTRHKYTHICTNLIF